MKAHNVRARALCPVLVAGCLAALAVPAAAMPRTDGAVPVRHENGPALSASNEAGARLDHRGLNEGTNAYTLPSAFSTDVQSSPPTVAATSPPGSVVHEIRTVTHTGGHTLAIVLAASALGIAIGGTGFAIVRLTRMQRRLVGSSS